MVIDSEEIAVKIQDVTSGSCVVTEELDINVSIQDVTLLTLSVNDVEEIQFSMSDMLVVERGEDIVRQMIVGETFIDSYKAVYLNTDDKVYEYDSRDTDLIGRFIGVTLESGNLNDVVAVQMSGVLTNAMWGFGTESTPVYASADGAISNTEHGDAVFTHELGVSLSNTSFLLKPKIAISKAKDDSSPDYTKVTAGTNISGHRVVATRLDGRIIHADSSDLTLAHSILGLSTQAIVSGEDGYVIEEGIFEEPTWSWTPMQALYFDTNGALTHTAPTAGFVCAIGYAVTNTKIMVRISQPVILA